METKTIKASEVQVGFYFEGHKVLHREPFKWTNSRGAEYQMVYFVTEVDHFFRLNWQTVEIQILDQL
jgi:hypothetical protein